MQLFIKKLEAKILLFAKSYGVYICGGLFVGVLTYFMMMSQGLVNDLDGLWHPSNFVAGNWEISLGRGLQRYADRARFGIVSEPFNTIVTLLIIVIANVMIIKQFQLQNVFYKSLLIIVLVANPIVCNSLSYSYMSVNFGLAYFFSVAAFCCMTDIAAKKRALGEVLAGGLLLGISMAFYQAYICVTCVLIVSFVLKRIVEGESVRRALQYIMKCFCMGICGGVIYFMITQVLLHRAGVEMASYRGASDISIIELIKNLPYSLRRCYEEFYIYVCDYKAMSKLEFIEVVLVALLIIYVIAVIIQFISIFRRSRSSALLFAVAISVLPVSSCFVLVITIGNIMTGIMSMGLLICVVIMGVIVPKEGKIAFWLKRGYLLVLVIFAWFQLSAVENDQIALKEGKVATTTLAENVVMHLTENGYLENGEMIAFVGRPKENSSFVRSTAYEMANGYAQFGGWSTNARNNRASWEGILSIYLGMSLSLCDDDTYSAITALEQVAEMPEFPSAGSVCVIDNIIVVKISEVY